MDKAERRKQDWETVKTIFWAVLIALTFRSFAYEPFHIPSGSMKPTLLVGDYIWVSKFSYGYSRYSFPFAPPVIKDRAWLTMPNRGDVVVFRPPSKPGIDYIKRVIGLPGDKIQVLDGHLLVNGTAVKEVEMKNFMDKSPDNPGRFVPQYLETLPAGEGGHEVEHSILNLDPNGPLDNTDIYTVPEGHIFCMGDNRDESVDSRVLEEVGYIPIANLIGRAEVIFFSTDGTARIWEPWKWFSALRTERLFKPIQ
ncbi:signal peptidase I [bacterium]|nr:signal peptidase I [bacterium]